MNNGYCEHVHVNDNRNKSIKNNDDNYNVNNNNNNNKNNIESSTRISQNNKNGNNCYSSSVSNGIDIINEIISILLQVHTIVQQTRAHSNVK